MVAAGVAAHSDHGRAVAEVFLSVARKETEDYLIKDPGKLLAIAHTLGVDTTVEVDGEQVDRNIDETAISMKSPLSLPKKRSTSGARPKEPLNI